MPRLSREVENKIIDLIEKGYKDAVISRELGVHRTTIADRRKAWEKRKQEKEKVEPEKEETIQQEEKDSHPLDPQIYTLIRYQGTHSREEALSQAIETQHSFNPYILNHGLKTPKELIKFFENEIQLERMKVNDLEVDSNISRSLFVTRARTELKSEAENQYDEGYQMGMDEHALLVPCTSCGEPITILPGTETHQIIVEFLREHEIIHNDCKPRYQRIYAT